MTRAGLRPDALLDDLNKDPDTFTRHLNTILKKATKSRAILLFLDQMEELFTSQDITQSKRFLTALNQAAQEKALWVVATIRSDHLQYCHRHDEMRNVLNGPGHYALGRMDRFMMHEMIDKPARWAGLSISDRLTSRLIADTEEDAVNLPLLAFVLNQLFKQRTDHELSEVVYGNLGGAIAAPVQIVEDQIQKELGPNTDEVCQTFFKLSSSFKKKKASPHVTARSLMSSSRICGKSSICW